MKQILQNLKTGEMLLEEVPAPKTKSGYILIQTTHSLISAGTERMLVNFGRAGYLEKARQQPEKVKQAINKVRTDGLLPTIETIFAKLDQPIPLGYCNVGRVIEVGEGVEGFSPGELVVSNGRHAEIVCVPKNLCTKIPESVGPEEAAFTVIASVGLQGIRLLNPTLGESVCVFGLGLIGLIACQLLRANGVKVLGFDYDADRVRLAKDFGAEAFDLSSGLNPVDAAMNFSNNHGMDAVLVTASTKSNDLIHQAAVMSRKCGRIILVGVAGLNINRADFYEKELSFQVSCSYGPGRYDHFYEEKGNDYPRAYVRWTEQRNFESILELLRTKLLNVLPLISQRISFDKAKDAYDLIQGKKIISIILKYPQMAISVSDVKRVIPYIHATGKGEAVVAGIIGAGNFTQLRMLPALKKTKTRLKWIASAQGVSSAHAARKFSIEKNTTDYRNILEDNEVNTIFITTRHSSHAQIVKEALLTGKNVFVEKPLCIKPEDLDQIAATHEEACHNYSNKLLLMVGFNRRFSPATSTIRDIIKDHQTPLAMNFTCNAGKIPAEHWVNDPDIGGGRIIGEAIHFIDYLQYLAGAPIVRVSASRIGLEKGRNLEDSAAITLVLADGSIGHINYFSEGAKNYSKEMMEIFFDSKVITLDNFKDVRGFGISNFRKKKLARQDKGHMQGIASFVSAISDSAVSPISMESIINVHQAAFAALEAMRSGIQIELPIKKLLR